MPDYRLLWPDLPVLKSFAHDYAFFSLGAGLIVESTTKVVKVHIVEPFNDYRRVRATYQAQSIRPFFSLTAFSRSRPASPTPHAASSLYSD